jgi:hypothetical protein
MGVTRSDAIQTIFTRTRWRARASIAPPEKHRRATLTRANRPSTRRLSVDKTHWIVKLATLAMRERTRSSGSRASQAMLYVEAVLKVREVPLESYRKLPACEKHC